MENIKIKTPEEVKRLRRLGHTYPEIVKLTGYSKSSVCYHIDTTQKDKVVNR